MRAGVFAERRLSSQPKIPFRGADQRELNPATAEE
jgi:hypothetical protein